MDFHDELLLNTMDGFDEKYPQILQNVIFVINNCVPILYLLFHHHFTHSKYCTVEIVEKKTSALRALIPLRAPFPANPTYILITYGFRTVVD